MIKPYENNARFHSPEQIELIAKSIKRFGWQQPIKVGKDNVIIVGHGRWFAYQAHKEKLKEPWVIDENGKTISGEAEKKKLTKKEEHAYRILDNAINKQAKDDSLRLEEEASLFEDDIELTEMLNLEQEVFDKEYSSLNQEVDIDKLEDNLLTITLKYNEEDYKFVKEKLEEIDDYPAQALLKLLHD